MALQFLCPEGHLLQGDESQVGQRCKCPYCHTEFLVPQAVGPPQADPAAAAPAPGGFSPPAGEQPAAAAPEPPQPTAFPGVRTGDGGGGPTAGEIPRFGPPAADQQGPLHIPCPNGHLLETPREMLGKDAMCPFCQAQFRLRFEDSREHQQAEAERRARREQKLGRAWMNWAIAAAVVVVLGIAVLIAIAASG